MLMVRNDHFTKWAFLALMVLTPLVFVCYYYGIWLLLAKYYQHYLSALVAVSVFILVDLLILGPRRECKAARYRKNKPERGR